MENRLLSLSIDKMEYRYASHLAGQEEILSEGPEIQAKLCDYFIDFVVVAIDTLDHRGGFRSPQKR